jgi:hypothetical protein
MTISQLSIIVLTIAGAGTLTPLLQLQAAAAKAPAAQEARPQDHEAHHPAAPAAQPRTPPASRTGGMQRMMADTKEQDARIDALVTRMNAAKGEAKIDAIAELLTLMAQQRREMEARMMQMHEQMHANK